MVEQHPDELDAIFHALGDATRRELVAMLAIGEHTVGELAAPFEMSLAAVSKHIKVLERAGLVHRDIRGRTHVCSLAADALAEAHAWLTRYQQFWTHRLDVLERLLRDEDHDAPSDPGDST